MLSASLLGLPLPNATLLASLRAYLAVNGVAMDNPPGLSLPKVSTFWYTLVNQAFFAGLSARVPSLDPDLALLHLAADSWHAATVAMKGDFRHTGFDFTTMKPFDDPRWREPDSAGGVAFVSVLAHHHSGDPRHLEAATLALAFLENQTASPLYEMMLPFGAYAAARLNAVSRTSFDVAKLVSMRLPGKTASMHYG